MTALEETQARSRGVSYQELLDGDSRPAPDVLRWVSPMPPGPDFVGVVRYTSPEFHRVEVEKLWKKMHEVRVKEGTLASWGVYARMLPEGSDYPYNFATTNAYARYKDLNGLDFQAAFQKANLGMNVNELAERTGKSRDLVRGEIWVLVDAVQAPPK